MDPGGQFRNQGGGGPRMVSGSYGWHPHAFPIGRKGGTQEVALTADVREQPGTDAGLPDLFPD